MKTISSPTIFLLFALAIALSPLTAQIATPTILEVKNDDYAATVYWNSKTATYDAVYDPYKQDGIYSYLIEWKEASSATYTHSTVTPYRVHMIQPVSPGVMYDCRVYALDSIGNKSLPSAVAQFTHDPGRVDSMRTRLNGFFDDFNQPMGPFDETKWNQTYSGCMYLGKNSQHINNQFHAHNVMCSGECDRGVASSRVREYFDFTNRTGIIEFDLDGSKLDRQFWYLDMIPAGRKRDITGHTSLEVSGIPPQSDPPHLFRILERGSQVGIQLTDDQGNLHTLSNMYQNGACGDNLDFCPGENLYPVPNVRRHWRIELSKTHIKIFINGILVVDGSLITIDTPNGLEFETAQVSWLLFSYNTTKENIPLSMVHWDNFGFDAPAGFSPTTVVHNYTDGILGTDVAPIGNEKSAGMKPTVGNPGLSVVPIPDQILDNMNNPPQATDLMFTVQGSEYTWVVTDSVMINGNNYGMPEPSSAISSINTNDLTSTTKPYSVLMAIDHNDLIQGNNQILFDLPDARILNVHIELTYPITQAPSYTQPKDVHPDHMQKLMAFKEYATVGPGIVFNDIDGAKFWQTSEFTRLHDPSGGLSGLTKINSVSDTIDLQIIGNSNAILTSTGTAKGITHYEILMDQIPIDTVRVDSESPMAYFDHKEIKLDTRAFCNGVHELFVRGYDVNDSISVFDVFSAHAHHGEYIPVYITIDNTPDCDTTTDPTSDHVLVNSSNIVVYPNPIVEGQNLFLDFETSDNIEMHITMYDVLGKEVVGYRLESEAQRSQLELPTSHLTSGIYQLVISDGFEGLFSETVMITR